MQRGPVARWRWGIKLADELDVDAQLDELAPEYRPRRRVRDDETDWRARLTESG